MNILQIPNDLWDTHIQKFINKEIFQLFLIFGTASKKCNFLWKKMLEKYLAELGEKGYVCRKLIPIECYYCKIRRDDNFSISCSWDIIPKRLIFTCKSPICVQVVNSIVDYQMGKEQICLWENNWKENKIKRSNGKFEHNVNLGYIQYGKKDSTYHMYTQWNDVDTYKLLQKYILLKDILNYNRAQIDKKFMISFPYWYPKPFMYKMSRDIKYICENNGITFGFKILNRKN